MYVSPSAWADQRSCQGDIIVINWLITIISPSPKLFKITVLTLTYTAAFIHASTYCDKQSSTSEQSLWEVN